MTEYERLVLEVEGKGAASTTKELKHLDAAAKQNVTTGGKLKATWVALGVAAGAVAGAVALVGGKLVQATRQYQDFIAQLKVSTKSAENAAIAYQAIEEFAATTPYSVAEATTAFIKLVNMGLTPSEKALRSYGNTASSMGKGLNDMIEAVADAATGEFERLKEFGIKANKQGEEITFRFQGVSTTVKNTATDIEDYLIRIGNVNFEGAMAERMKTLGGVMSNLGDSWDRLWVNISKQGPDSLITAAFQKASDTIEHFNKQLSGGEFEIWLARAKTSILTVGLRFVVLKEDIRLVAKGIVDNFQIEWDRLVKISAATARNVAAHFAGATGGNFTVTGQNIEQDIKNINNVANAKKKATAETFKVEQDANNALFDQTIDVLNLEEQAALDRVRIEQEAARARGGGDLGRFKVGGGEGATLGKGKAGKGSSGDAVQKAADTALASLVESLATEEQKIEASYLERQNIILSNTKLTEDSKTALMLQITKAREEAISAIEEETMQKRLGQAATFFGNIAKMGSTFGKEGFEIAKAAAIAEATINTYAAATAAYKAMAGIPYIGPALGIAAAGAAIVAGAANIATIKAQQYQGAYARGGMISAGKYGLVGESGPELVRGPAVVTSAATTASKSQSRGVRSVTVNNYGQPVAVESKMNGEELLVILRPLLQENKEATKREIAGDIHKGGSKVASSMERTYGLRRGLNT
jgi:hypothetical protein